MVCPLCHSVDYATFLKVKDYTVSHELFILAQCNSCSFIYTFNPPDASAINRYYQSSSYISHTDGKETLFERCYQIIRKSAIAGKKRLVESFCSEPQKRILDYGCGTGSFLKKLQDAGWSISGIENDPGAQQKASQYIGKPVHSPNHLEAFATSSFHVVTLWHVLEHVHDLNFVLSQFSRILLSNGYLIIAVPNYHSYDAGFYKEYWAAYDVPRHLYHFSPVTLENLLKKHGFELHSKYPMWFDAFYVSILSEKYMKSSWGIVRAFFIGLLSNAFALGNINKCSSLTYVFKKINPS